MYLQNREPVIVLHHGVLPRCVPERLDGPLRLVEKPLPLVMPLVDDLLGPGLEVEAHLGHPVCVRLVGSAAVGDGRLGGQEVVGPFELGG